MVFVTLGTQDKGFLRLLEKIDELIDKKIIKDKVIVQAGVTKYKSSNMQMLDLIPMDKFNKYILESNYIITHGGVGSIIAGIKNNKKIIAVARLKKYDEHENDHQLQIIDNFSKNHYILDGTDLQNLESVIKQLDSFKPKKYKSNNKKITSLISNYIDSF